MTGSVPRARRRAPATPSAPTTLPAAAAPSTPATAGGPGGTPPGAAPPAERLAALLAEARAQATVPGQGPAPADRPPDAVPGHRRQVAARTRVPGSLLLLALAALGRLAWTVLGPGEDGEAPETAGRPVLAEAELGGDAGPGAGQDTGHGDVPGADTGAETGPGRVPAAPTPAAASTLYVHVTGEVARPGVVSLEAGARVVDAVEAAGGLTDAAVTDTVNLAAPVADGQQVLVPDSATAPVPEPRGPRERSPGPGSRTARPPAGR